MTNIAGSKLMLERTPLLCASMYALILLLSAYVVVESIVDLASSRREVINAAEILARFTARSSPSKTPIRMSSSVSPFIQGTTLTMAKASLLQRIDAAVSRFGGSALSSEIETAHARADSIEALVACDIDSNGLQNLLYDLEAGIPFLFVDQLTIQAKPIGGAARLHVLLGVTGQWEGAK